MLQLAELVFDPPEVRFALKDAVTSKKPKRSGLSRAEKRLLVAKKFSAKRQVYENCRMLSQNGTLLCFCDMRKVRWYEVSSTLPSCITDNCTFHCFRELTGTFLCTNLLSFSSFEFKCMPHRDCTAGLAIMMLLGFSSEQVHVLESQLSFFKLSIMMFSVQGYKRELKVKSAQFSTCKCRPKGLENESVTTRRLSS